MKVSVKVAFVPLMFLAAPSLAASIAGWWKIDDQPAWIEISVDPETAMGVGIVRRHDIRPQAVGRVILKDARLVDDGVWKGQIYAARLDDFRDASIETSGADSLAIHVRAGIMRRTVSWSRAEAQNDEPVQREASDMSTHQFMPGDAALAALAEQPDDGPVVMLNLLEYADDGGESYARYGRIALQQITIRGGRILYSGTPLTDNPESGHWDRLVLVFYPSRAAFLDMMADPEYQAGLPHRSAGLKRTVLYAFSPRPDAPALETVPTQGGEEIFVLNLMRFKPDGGREDYQKYGAVVLPMVMERGGSPVVILDAEVPLVSEEAWEDLYLVRYPTLDALQQMVATETWQKANVDRERGLDLTWAFPTRP